MATRIWRLGRWLGLVLAVATWAAPAMAQTATVLRVQGEAVALAQAGSRPLAVGDPVRAGERLKTGPAARLELRFADGMDVILGAEAELLLAEFVWDATGQRGQAALEVAAGAFLVESGAVGKLPGHPLTVKTPLASVGVRGTRFWGGPLEAPLNVLLLDGRVVVTTAQGSVELVDPGAGTAVTAPGEAPTAPAFWGDERIGHAIATVSFGP